MAQAILWLSFEALVVDDVISSFRATSFDNIQCMGRKKGGCCLDVDTKKCTAQTDEVSFYSITGSTRRNFVDAHMGYWICSLCMIFCIYLVVG